MATAKKAPAKAAPAAKAPATKAAPAGVKAVKKAGKNSGPGFDMPIQNFDLPNGLRVLIQQDRRTPRVGVAIQYHVGFRTTPQGFRGLPHIVEHLMFTGSEHAPAGVAAYFEPAGGTDMNGETSQDATTYYVELPARELDLALWLESDRMGYLITALDEAKVARERSVVLQEWRERVSGRASGWLTEVVQQQIYPPGHPYHLVGDDPNHVASIRLAHVQWFLQQYYVPNNATIGIVGDVDPARALASVERYFGSIPPSEEPVPTPARAVVRFESGRFLAFEAPTYTDTVMLMWPTPPYLEADDATLDVVAKLLDRRLESMVGGALLSAGASQASHHLASEFTIALSFEPATDDDHPPDLAAFAADRLVVAHVELAFETIVDVVRRDVRHRAFKGRGALIDAAAAVRKEAAAGRQQAAMHKADHRRDRQALLQESEIESHVRFQPGRVVMHPHAADHGPIGEIKGECDVVGQSVGSVDGGIESEETVGLHRHGHRHGVFGGVHQVVRRRGLCLDEHPARTTHHQCQPQDPCPCHSPNQHIHDASKERRSKCALPPHRHTRRSVSPVSLAPLPVLLTDVVVGLDAAVYRYPLVIGIRRSFPNARCVILMPSGACLRLYSLRSTIAITRTTVSRANPIATMSSNARSSST